MKPFHRNTYSLSVSFCTVATQTPTIKLITKIRTQNSFQALVGIAKTRKLQDGRKVSEIKTRGQQVYLNGLDIPVFLSWVWLKRDGKRVQRFIISTKPMKGKTIARWGKRRW